MKMKICKIKNFRQGLATNSSSTHSIIYKNKEDMFEDLNIFEYNYYDRYLSTIAVSKEAKIKYVLACIKYDTDLVNMLMAKYPEMIKYCRLIKDNINNTIDMYYEDPNYFGQHCRGAIISDNNIHFNYEYLIEVIENPEIVIVGGSDETDFFYETVKGHTELDIPYEYGRNKNIILKNGNYWVVYNQHNINIESGTYTGKLRISSDDELLPEYPELIDLKLTNKCEHACPFCFMDSNNKEKHADINFIKSLINDLKSKVEFSIGGGNILLYPELEEVLKYIKEKNHIINVTINEKDCKTILNTKKYKDIFNKYIDGIGISIIKLDDIDSIQKFYKEFNYTKFITTHYIPELLGVDKVLELTNKLLDNGIYVDKLFLGYKDSGRGKNQTVKKLSNEELNKLFNNISYISIDTKFANTYLEYLKEKFYIDKLVTLNEGEFSLYADAVEKKIYKSSYHLDKPYELYNYYAEWGSNENEGKLKLKEIFKNIRQDCGFNNFEGEVNNFYNKF